MFIFSPLIKTRLQTADCLGNHLRFLTSLEALVNFFLIVSVSTYSKLKSCSGGINTLENFLFFVEIGGEKYSKGKIKNRCISVFITA